jgi:penicillin-binding protein-related factor A (putative recombinase)
MWIRGQHQLKHFKVTTDKEVVVFLILAQNNFQEQNEIRDSFPKTAKLIIN